MIPGACFSPRCACTARVPNVRPIYEHLVKVASSPRDTVANGDEVIATLAPLGLRWRSRKVLETASELLERFDGHVPRDETSLRSLPGVGDYAASAVRCFAFGEPAVLIDANSASDRLSCRGHRRASTRLDSAP